jgi:starch synthase (maltosyl-transferring)
MGRLQILDVAPAVDGGTRPARAVPGELFEVSALVFREGHESVAAQVVLTPTGTARRHLTRMRETVPGTDRFTAWVSADEEGPWTYRVEAWSDPVATWLRAAQAKAGAGTATHLDFAEGLQLLKRIEAETDLPLTAGERDLLAGAAAALADTTLTPERRLATLLTDPAAALWDTHPLRDLLTAGTELPLRVDPVRALYGSWYELFPRSEGAVLGAQGVRSGTLRTAAERLPAVAAMGFDVVYLPPIHPIGHTGRKGQDNRTSAQPGDPGSPWAIGAAQGGHDTVHPDLGTLADFDHFVSTAAGHGLQVALDFALQCSPDHPWVREHPNWFRHRLDGSIAYAENPPKKYQDIYPLDFDADPEGILAESLRVLRHWMGHGIRIFRVDNPHTKPAFFWDRLLTDIHATDPDVIFLAEAFTRPPMLKTLARIGFHQSYTYFTWRDSKQELTEYLSELAGLDGSQSAAYLRPNLFVNTPDILPRSLRDAPRSAFAIRAVLAAAAGPAWGVYAGFEVFESSATGPGTEEYLHSEKYQYRPRDWAATEAADTLAPLITRLNQIRRAHPALQQLRNLRFHSTADDAVLCFSKRVRTPEGDDWVLAVINLDPQRTRETEVFLDLQALGLSEDARFEAYDVLDGAAAYRWGRVNYVRLDPAHQVAHLLTPAPEPR